MNKTLKKKPDFRISNNIFSEKGKLWEFCYIKYFNLRKSVNLKILKRVTLKLDKWYQAVVLILPWNVICHFKRPVVFWAMFVSVLGQNQRGNRLVLGLEHHNLCATWAWAVAFQVSGDLRSLEDCTPFF